MTADKVTVVAVVPNQTQLDAQVAARTTTPQLRATMQLGTYPDAINDQLQPLMEYYETWGRDIEVKVFTSTGDDEAAQRADAVAIKAMRPFAVLDMMSTGLDVLDGEIAKGKIPVWGFSASSTKANAEAPYRWGQNDAQAATINAGEVLGKQLAGKKAEFGGDDVKATKRAFGLVYLDGVIDPKPFEKELGKYGGKVVSTGTYESNGSVRGEPDKAAEFAPTLVTRMKAAGVTTVVLFSDTAMNAAMMDQANKQEWFPEWFLTGSFYQDIAVLTRSNPPEQMAHVFGLSNFGPYIDPSLVTSVNPLDWYWGTKVGTTSNTAAAPLAWLLGGIHAAGPKLTPKTFQQGLFSVPAAGGAVSGSPLIPTTGFGKGARLPYDEYMLTGFDFAPIWWDTETTGPSQAVGLDGKGVAWFVDGGKRYLAGTYPKKQFAWFDKDGALLEFDAYPGDQPTPAPACTTCPAATGAPAGATDPSTIVAKWGGTGSQT